MQPTTDLRFPIGKFKPETDLTPDRRSALIRIVAETPEKLREAVRGLSPGQLDTPYRPGGWTVRQVVHHLPDSHLNSYVRFKLALTEERPVIKPYEEDRWAELADTFNTPTEVSVTLLESLHVRWVNLLRALTEAEWRRTFLHPQNGEMPLTQVLALYAWHGAHHVAHITSLRERMGW
ncbi:MAG: Putative metal-dependent hydrolase YfiT [uncultured Cytophagales bacterium]|uniref:Metal-dependent hydrolase YfiT n=1 Tax=uncultured Cytophagales bacterium TaxID=158755 RepID=A0A6J4LXD6_9SPHI|nr:MAG: Putative metal-dependent hydrolase YfiT [uncultured Cytophagales bacterium]